MAASVEKPPMVIVTLTDYVTVTPTLPAAISTVTASVDPSLGLGSVSASIDTSTMHDTLSVALSQFTFPLTTAGPIVTGIPALPPAFAKPNPQPTKGTGLSDPDAGPPKAKYNGTFAAVTISAIAVMALLLCTLIGYMCYLRAKGKCQSCKSNEDKLEKWEKGELKVITKAMVKSRESHNSDVEKGDGGGAEEADKHTSFWERVQNQVGITSGHMKVTAEGLKSKMKVTATNIKAKFKGEKPPESPGIVIEHLGPQLPYIPAQPSFQQRMDSYLEAKARETSRRETAGDRFFRVDSPVVQKSETPVLRKSETPSMPHDLPYEPMVSEPLPYDSAPYEPASPSIYSQTTAAGPARVFGDQSGWNVSPVESPQLKNPYRYSAAVVESKGGHRKKDSKAEQAEASLIGARYKAAERDMRRASVTETELHRAVDVINAADHQARRAWNASLFTEVETVGGKGDAAEDDYQMPGWRKSSHTRDV